ncbi:MAG: hypothetical protein ABIP20_00220, partial [Chthoniobacteraceae bacterium]
MKSRALLSATLAALAAFAFAPCRAERVVAAEFVQFGDLDIFDNGAVEEAEGVQIVNGRVVLVGSATKKPDKP